MDATLTYKCPNCDAGLRFDAAEAKFVCDFCISSFTESELDKTDAAKRAKEHEAEDAAFSEGVNEYRCQSCGAEVIADKSTAADFCYYCHNPVVLVDRVTGALAPSKIIPFKLDKKAAGEAFLRYAKKKWFVPSDYFAPERSDKIAGVYYPFWVTDADAVATMFATGYKVRTWRMGNYRYTETSRFAVRRGGNIHFEDISNSAISTEDKKMLEGILPYPTDEHIDFEMPYLQGFLAKKRDIEREDLSLAVRGQMEGYSETLLSNTVDGYARVDSKNTEMVLHRSRWDYTLFPIWILTYRRKGKNYTYAMNGSTGKIYGELPVSPVKLGLFSAAVALVAGLLSFLIGWGLFL